MTDTNSLSPSDQRMLLCLYQHRLLTTNQLYVLVADLAANRRWIRERLAALHAAGLVDRVRASGQQRLFAWYATDLGARLAESSASVPARPYRVTPELAGGPLQGHTLAVNAVGASFVAHAARLAESGYECSPLDWIPEVAHRLSDHANGPMLVSDAVIRCVVPRASTRVLVRAFLELDRATMSVERLAEKIGAYGRYHAYRPGAGQPGRTVAGARPAWQHLYPAWPRLMFVFAQPAGRRVALEARIQDLAMLTQRSLHRGQLPREMEITACLLDDLAEHGPFAPIHSDLVTGEAQVALFGSSTRGAG